MPTIPIAQAVSRARTILARGAQLHAMSALSRFAELGLVLISWIGGILMAIAALAIPGSVSLLYAAIAALVLAIAGVRTVQGVARLIRRARARRSVA